MSPSSDVRSRIGPRPSEARVNLLVGVMCLVWGSTWLVVKTGLEDLPPLSSAGIRFLVASAVMVGLAPHLARREGGEAPAFRLWATVGTLNFAVSYGLVYFSETVLPSGLVCVLWSVFPLMMAASGHLFIPGERLGPRHWIGLVLGFAGILLIFRTDVNRIGPGATGVAALLMLSPLVSALGQTLVKRHGTGASSALMNRNAMCLGAVLLLAGGVLFERDRPMAFTPAALFSIGYLALAGTVLTFSIYFYLLRHAPAYRLSLITYVTPVIALALGWIVYGEPLGVGTVAGSALVLFGVGLVLRPG